VLGPSLPTSGPFAPLRHERFRGLWAAGLVSFVGTWIHAVAARWTAATLTDSPLAVSAIDTLALAPMLVFSFVGGRLADRFDRRKILAGTHLALAGAGIVLGVFAAAGKLTLPVLYLVITFNGVIGALIGPAWQAVVPRQVPEEEIPGAIALMSTAFNLARAVGPAVGAWMLTVLGTPVAFFTNALSYGLIAWLTWSLPPQRSGLGEVGGPSPIAIPALRRLFAAIVVYGFAGMPSLSLLPVVARDLLLGDATQYGRLLSAFGAGAVVAGLGVATGARRLGNRRFVALAALASAAGMGVLAAARSPAEGMLGAALCGVGWIGTISTINAAVHHHAPPACRGSAFAWYITAAVAGQSTGSLVAGWVAEAWSTRIALGGCAGIVVAMAVVVAWPARGRGGRGGR
jgi:MFS family permease